MNRIFNKRLSIIIINILLLIMGIAIGSSIPTVSSEVELANITDDTTYDKLVDMDYDIYYKDITELEDGFQGNFILIIYNELSENELFELGKAIYENTVSKQKKLQQVNIDFYLGSIGSGADDFYNENLLYRINYEKPLNRIVTSEYILNDNIEEDVNRTTWVINNISESENTINVDISMQDNISDEDMLSQAKGLTAQIRELNSSIINQDERFLSIISNSTNDVLLYNSNFENVYVKSNYKNIV